MPQTVTKVSSAGNVLSLEEARLAKSAPRAQPRFLNIASHDDTDNALQVYRSLSTKAAKLSSELAETEKHIRALLAR